MSETDMKELENFNAILDMWKWEEELKAKRRENSMSANPLSSVPGLRTMQAISATRNRKQVYGLMIQNEERYSYRSSHIGTLFLFFLGGILVSILLVRLCFRFINDESLIFSQAEVIDAEISDDQRDDYDYPYENIDEALRDIK